MVPAHVGIDDPTRWTCRCPHCAERFGGPVPGALTPEVQAFREASVVDFLRELVAHVAGRGGKNTICLLPATGGAHGISDWNLVASLPGLTTFATDPYWKHWSEPAGPFVRRFARLLRETCERHGVQSQLWLPSFGLTKGEIPELEAAIAAARDEGVDDLWTWGYEACGHMTSLATPDSPLVWEAVSAALTGKRQEHYDDLETRTTRELVALLNAEDATVASAVAEAGDALAAAIEQIAGRIAGGGRLVYVGAGTSGRLAKSSRSSPATAKTPRTTSSAATPMCGRSGSEPRTPSSPSARAGRPRTRSPRSRLHAPSAHSVLRSCALRTVRWAGWPSTRSPSSSAPRSSRARRVSRPGRRRSSC